MKNNLLAPRFFLLKVINPHTHREDAIKNLSEVESLVKTYGGDILVKDIQHRPNPHPATYIGTGKIEKIKQIILNKKIDIVVLNDIVNSGQIFPVPI